MSGDEFIEGVGYLYTGAWLGTDPAAFKPVRLNLASVEGSEEETMGDGTKFTRVVTKTGHVWIIFQIRPRPSYFTVPVTTLKSQPVATAALPAKASRIFYLPASLPRHDKDE